MLVALRNTERKNAVTDAIVMKETKGSETKGKHSLKDYNFKLRTRGVFIQLMKYLSRYLLKNY